MVTEFRSMVQSQKENPVFRGRHHGPMSHETPLFQETTFTYEELTEDYPRYPDVQDLDMSTVNPEDILDVSRYMNSCPYTVFHNTAVPQVFNLFRSMGLRHLPVINHQGQLVGMITRHNLTHHYLEEKLHHHGNNH